MSFKTNVTYFAADEAETLSAVLQSKADDYYRFLHTSGYFWKISRSWAFYENVNTTNSWFDGSAISFGGEQGELAQMSVNQYKNIADHIIAMIISTRPAFSAKATNTDSRSLVQAKLANQLLDYYQREKRLEKYIEKAVRYAVVLGSGYVRVGWNATSGEIYDHTEDGAPIYEGDLEFTNVSPFDVFFDATKGAQDHDWHVVRSFKNKFDLIAKYPDLEEKIRNLPTKNEMYRFQMGSIVNDETDDIPYYEFFHVKSESVPHGRYMVFLDKNVVLLDGPMPYRSIPLFRIAPSEVLGTPYGSSPMFDLMPLQEAINSLYSTILSNQHAFGVQNIAVPRNADINFRNLEGGLNIVEYNPTVGGGGKPEALQLTATPQEVFTFLDKLESEMERISGINSVVRGNPESNLKSGTALAMVQSTALQFISPLQMSYVRLLEDVGTCIVSILRDFATVPRVAMVAGKSNTSMFEKEFTGEDLQFVNRVVVEVSNPLGKCLKKDTPVLMFDGSIKKVQDISAGEQVMGPDSKIRTVQSIAIGEEQMYDIYQNKENGSFLYGCNESHILSLKYCANDGKYGLKKDQILDMSVKEYLGLNKHFKSLLMGFRTGVDFDKKDLKIPPYILGMWLGDEHSSCPGLTTMDKELSDIWTNYASDIGMNIRIQDQPNNKSKVYFITSSMQNGPNARNNMTNMLREMDLIDNKHIPSSYNTSSREDRLLLLAGLIDTDGTLTDETFTITQKNTRLSEGIVFLSRSLGFRTVLSKINRKCQNGFIGEYNSITIGGNTWEIPTRLERKQPKEKVKARSWLNYGIDIRPAGMGTYYGFTLVEEPHFLLGDFTVTHNTTAGRVQIAQELLQYGLIKTPQDYFTILNTGNLEVMTDDATDENINIRLENEKLLSGRPVKALSIDQHKQHILTHRSLISDPDMRENEELVQIVLDHISQHINLLKTIDPALLGMIGEQSLAPPPDQQMPGAQQGQPTQQAPQSSPPPSNGGVVAQQAPQNTQDLPNGEKVPNVSKLPKSPNNAPVTAAESMAQKMGGG